VGLAGVGLPPAALAEAALSRLDAEGRDEAVPIRLGEALASPGGEADLVLEDGDRLFIPARAHWKEGAAVEVQGEVARPGLYPIRDGVDRLRSVIERAGGLTEFADGARARVERTVAPASPDTAFLGLARGATFSRGTSAIAEAQGASGARCRRTSGRFSRPGTRGRPRASNGIAWWCRSGHGLGAGRGAPPGHVAYRRPSRADYGARRAGSPVAPIRAACA
jgi:hypothetical protein